MVLDISGLGYFMPIFGFLFVFVIVYALLAKTNLLGDSKAIDLIISAIVAVVFSTVSSVQNYVQNVTPWFAVLLIAIFFILIILGFTATTKEVMKPGFAWAFIIVLILIFLVSATNVFSATFSSAWSNVADFVTTEARIAGAILLLIIGGITAWVIAK